MNLTPYIYGARHCASCHDQERTGRLSSGEIKELICRMVEFPIYEAHDKHKLAYSALTGDRAREMSRSLGYEVKTSEACLACHSTTDRNKGTQFYSRADDGITCVACHGTVAEWVEIHQRTDNGAWRELDPQTKEKRYGMIDLWNPVRRAEICASCHIGNHAQGKMITHAMYAAGHPPLPGFETATFSDAQPPHWQSLAEKTRDQKKRLDPTHDSRNLEQSQLVLVGGLVAFRESMKQFADQAAAGEEPGAAGASWPDFARYDCIGCHHDLRADKGASWRQLRRRSGNPGRPGPAEWPLVLVRLLIDSADQHQDATPEARLLLHLGAFEQSLMIRPFGGPDIAGDAERVVRSTEPLIQGLNHTLVDAAKARQLLLKLCAMARETIPDYDSARQIAWAFKIIYRESVPGGEPSIETTLIELEKDLTLSLPPARTQGLIVPTLPDRLKQLANFEPESFQDHFQKLAERIATLPPVQESRR